MPIFWGEHNGKNGQYDFDEIQLKNNFDQYYFSEKLRENQNKSDIDTSVETNNTCKNDLTTRPRFNEKLYHKSDDCTECSQNYTDPKRDELIMHLHALSYKVMLIIKVNFFQMQNKINFFSLEI